MSRQPGATPFRILMATHFQKLLAFLWPPHPSYILVDGKVKRASREEVMAYMGSTNPFIYQHHVKDSKVHVVVLFVPVNMDNVHNPKLFAIDAIHDDAGIIPIARVRTLEEALHRAEFHVNGLERLTAEVKLMKDTRDTDGLFSA